MNDTTKWIMIILLLLLIGAAVFMLLRSPGKENGEADVPPADADRDGVADVREGGTGAVTGADRGVYDQEAEAAPAEPVADEPAYETVADEPVADERAYDEPAPEVYEAEPAAEPKAAGTTAGTTGADLDEDGAEPYRPEAGAYEADGGPDGTAAPEARPLSDEEIEAGGREEPLDTADQEPLVEEPVVEEPAPTSGTFHQETLPTEEAPAEGHAPAQESPVGEESTTYRAGDGAAARVDEPAGDASVTDTVTPAPADAGSGAPQTADDIVAGADAAGTRDASGTTDTGYAPVFAEAAYGPGSAEPLEDGTGPAGWQIKGNAGSMLFHTPESPSYEDVRAEVWFESEEAARAAGFAHWDRRQR
ncbi:MAG: hypothetical protein DCC50_00430 [Acidobacteria bacterium]|nr:MAG: hypothetical protein DCC50_00430 [Acidobacteriota bacterium]